MLKMAESICSVLAREHMLFATLIGRNVSKALSVSSEAIEKMWSVYEEEVLE